MPNPKLLTKFSPWPKKAIFILEHSHQLIRRDSKGQKNTKVKKTRNTLTSNQNGDGQFGESC